MQMGIDSGSMRIDEEKVLIDVPRVRDTNAEKEWSLRNYQAMKEADAGDKLTRPYCRGSRRETMAGWRGSLSMGLA